MLSSKTMNPLRRTLTNPDMERVLQVMDLFRMLDKEVPAQVIACFLYIASHDNCHKTALEQDLEMSTASGSRNTDWLSDHHRLQKPGMNLITKEVDPSHRKRIQLKLTDKGRDIVERIEEILYG